MAFSVNVVNMDKAAVYGAYYAYKGAYKDAYDVYYAYKGAYKDAYEVFTNFGDYINNLRNFQQ